MSSASDASMLRLTAPRNALQITNGEESQEGVIEIPSAVSWVRSLTYQQQQAEEDLQFFYETCKDRTDIGEARLREIERAYYTLYEGTRYVYQRLLKNEVIAETWVRNELALAANAYQTFARRVWQTIAEKTTETTE